MCLGKYLEIHHVVNDHRETPVKTLLGDIPALGETYSRIESCCEEFCCIDKRLAMLLVACDAECVTLAAVHHESYVVVADYLSLDVEFLGILFSKCLDVLVL